MYFCGYQISVEMIKNKMKLHTFLPKNSEFTKFRLVYAPGVSVKRDVVGPSVKHISFFISPFH